MAHAYRSLYYHLVFRVSGCKILASDLPDLHAYMCKVLEEKGCKSITIGGIEDHVHVLAEFPLDALSDTISKLKIAATKLLKRRAPAIYGEFSWQRGYALFTVSYSRVAAVATYVENQRKHHAEMSYQDELEKHINFHNMEYHPEWEH